MVHPLISIILPIYNAETTLKKAVESIKVQTIGFDRLEVLLCDDCSTDGSFQIEQSLALQYPNVSVLRTEKNSGAPGAARNRGLQAAAAEYVMFLDDDDSLLPNACEVLYEAIETSHADIVQGTFLQADGCGNTTIVNKAACNGFQPGSYSLRSVNSSIAKACLPLVWDKIFRLSIFRNYEIGFSEGSFAEDDAACSLAISVSDSVQFIDSPIVRYNLGSSDSITASAKQGWYTKPMGASFAYMIQQAKRLRCEDRIDALYKEKDRFALIARSLVCSPNAQDSLRRLMEWKHFFAYAYEKGYEQVTAEAQILFRDAARGDDKQMLFDFSQLHDLHAQRQQELDNIFNSTTWKIASLLQKLKRSGS